MTNNKKAILVVSFGTSYKETREKTIGAIENDIAAAFPEWQIHRAFTSGMVLKVLKDRDGLHIDNVKEAMSRLLEAKVETVVVQPTHVINGDEYEKMLRDIEDFKDKFKQIQIGKPLLTDSKDYDMVVEAIMSEIPSLKKEQALVLMGHGTEHHVDAVYAAFDYRLKALNYENAYVGTVEGYPAIDEVIKFVKQKDYKEVLLMPFMIVAGDHAINDMASDEEDSWKSIFEKEGYGVQCILKGLGEFKPIRQIFIRHIQEIMY